MKRYLLILVVIFNISCKSEAEILEEKIKENSLIYFNSKLKDFPDFNSIIDLKLTKIDTITELQENVLLLEHYDLLTEELSRDINQSMERAKLKAKELKLHSMMFGADDDLTKMTQQELTEQLDVIKLKRNEFSFYNDQIKKILEHKPDSLNIKYYKANYKIEIEKKDKSSSKTDISLFINKTFHIIENEKIIKEVEERFLKH